jgi:hypothetical protein
VFSVQDFKIKERCLEEMAAEDRLSRLFERQHKFAARWVPPCVLFVCPRHAELAAVVFAMSSRIAGV